MTSWTTIDPPVTDPVPLPGGAAPRDGAPRELLVAVRGPADLLGPLAQAAARAGAEDRPLCVVVVQPDRARTIDAAGAAVQECHQRPESASAVAAVRVVCRGAGVPTPEIVPLRPARAWTHRGRERRLAAQLVALARWRGAELHPGPCTGAGASGAVTR